MTGTPVPTFFEGQDLTNNARSIKPIYSKPTRRFLRLANPQNGHHSIMCQQLAPGNTTLQAPGPCLLSNNQLHHPSKKEKTVCPCVCMFATAPKEAAWRHAVGRWTSLAREAARSKRGVYFYTTIPSEQQHIVAIKKKTDHQ